MFINFCLFKKVLHFKFLGHFPLLLAYAQTLLCSLKPLANLAPALLSPRKLPLLQMLCSSHTEHLVFLWMFVLCSLSSLWLWIQSSISTIFSANTNPVSHFIITSSKKAFSVSKNKVKGPASTLLKHPAIPSRHTFFNIRSQSCVCLSL